MKDESNNLDIDLYFHSIKKATELNNTILKGLSDVGFTIIEFYLRQLETERSKKRWEQFKKDNF